MIVRALEIPADHPAFAGHFPGMPILPGAVLLDEALYVIERDLRLDLTQWRLSAAKFLERVGPGDALSLEHAAARDDTVRFTVRVAGRPALTATLTRVAAGACDDA
ncbi:MAG TPA: hypothetical protein VK437_09985 [Steroidobacteraceae bacterium]|nr:hypothetical protein [Steroidobacteraceae bacterium]